jgi:hypothetical protein
MKMSMDKKKKNDFIQSIKKKVPSGYPVNKNVIEKYRSNELSVSKFFVRIIFYTYPRMSISLRPNEWALNKESSNIKKTRHVRTAGNSYIDGSLFFPTFFLLIFTTMVINLQDLFNSQCTTLLCVFTAFF